MSRVNLAPTAPPMDESGVDTENLVCHGLAASLSSPQDAGEDNSDVSVSAEKNCAICLGPRQRKCVILNCFHSSCCLECALKIMRSTNSTCPICRTQIHDVKEIFE